MDGKMEYVLFLSVCWTCSKGVLIDPCVNYKFLGNTDLRGQQCHLYDVGSALCDRLSINNKEWFAAKHDGVYLEMPTVCPTLFACDTSAPIWLNGTHPNITEGIVERDFCVRGIYADECCKSSIPGKIKNCGTFFVFKLTTTECDSAYCFGDHKCPASVYDNSTGLPPNDPCMSAKPLPQSSLRGTNCPVFEVETPICDRLITPGWYNVKVRDKNVDMPTNCISGGTCGTSAPIWLNGTLPSKPYETVKRKACAAGYIPGECCKKSYDIIVKNCVSHNVYYLPYTDACNEAFCFGSNKCIIIPDNSADVSNGISPKEIAMYTGIATVIILMVLIFIILVLRFYSSIGRWRKVSAVKSQKTESTTLAYSVNTTNRTMAASPPPPYKA